MARMAPPMRPPPPNSASPAHVVQAPAAPKSAFDDLNETIQLALGNSPAKQTTNQTTLTGQPIVGGQTGAGGNAYQQPAYNVLPQQQQMFASPSKQAPSSTGQH